MCCTYLSSDRYFQPFSVRQPPVLALIRSKAVIFHGRKRFPKQVRFRNHNNHQEVGFLSRKHDSTATGGAASESAQLSKGAAEV